MSRHAIVGLCSVRLIFTVKIFQHLRSKWISAPPNGRPWADGVGAWVRPRECSGPGAQSLSELAHKSSGSAAKRPPQNDREKLRKRARSPTLSPPPTSLD